MCSSIFERKTKMHIRMSECEFLTRLYHFGKLICVRTYFCTRERIPWSFEQISRSKIPPSNNHSRRDPAFLNNSPRFLPVPILPPRLRVEIAFVTVPSRAEARICEGNRPRANSQPGGIKERGLADYTPRRIPYGSDSWNFRRRERSQMVSVTWRT